MSFISPSIFRIFIFSTTILLAVFNLSAQNIEQKITLHFQPTFNEKNITLEQGLTDQNGDSLSIHTLRFYLGNFTFYKNGKEIGRENESHHLLDLKNPNSLSIILHLGAVIDFDAIKFALGTDSLTNVSGAMGDDLDPTKGMYWAWNSGYINFKMEGFSEKCPAQKNQFQFHIGGYMPPFQTVQTIELPVAKNGIIQVDMELSYFFEKIDLAKTHSIMSPSESAAELAKLLSKTFHIHGE